MYEPFHSNLWVPFKEIAMEFVKKMLVAALIAMPFSSSIAGEGSGKVGLIIAHQKIVNGTNGGVIMFEVTNHDNPPSSCPGHEWAFDANDPHGKAMYALLLSASAQGKDVAVHGSGDCGAWPDRERPLYIWMR